MAAVASSLGPDRTVADRQWRRLHLGGDPVVGRAGTVGRATDPARGARVERVAELLVERHGLVAQETFEVLGRIHHAIEHDRSYVGREQLCVAQPEQRAVRVAKVRELLVADGGPDRVHVAHDVVGADVAEQGPTVLGAVVGDRLGGIVELLLLGGVVGARVEPMERRVGLVAARELLAAADAAWVEADDVEAVGDVAAEPEPAVTDELDAGAAGTARVHEQRADPPGLVLGRLADRARSKPWDRSGRGSRSER